MFFRLMYQFWWINLTQMRTMVLELDGLYGATLPLERFDVENLPSMWGDHFHVFFNPGFWWIFMILNRKKQGYLLCGPPAQLCLLVYKPQEL
jgi:hypothetical protein